MEATVRGASVRVLRAGTVHGQEDNIGSPEVTAGDALDDLADIAVDLQEVLDRAKVSIDEAVWEFRFGFAAHWGTHLRWLQVYLHANRS